MSAPDRVPPNLRFLSRRARAELGSLQASVQELGVYRNTALRIFVASRHAATAIAQHDFWLEFSWADQEYRAAVRRLAEFCLVHRERWSSSHSGRAAS